MPKIIFKNSSAAGKKPTASDLALGELAVNSADGSLFVKKADGSVVTPTAPFGGVGDIVTTSKDLSATHLLCDGAKYLKSAYPELAAVVGSIPDDNFSTGKQYMDYIPAEGGYEALVYIKVKQFYLMMIMNGRWYKSTNALDWTLINGGGTGGIFVPTYSNTSTYPQNASPVATDGAGTWVFVNRTGYIYRSTDNLDTIGAGVRPSASTTTVFGSVAYGNGRFVAVGYDTTGGAGFIYTSTDGVTWTMNTTPSLYPFTLRPLYVVNYDNGIFFVVGKGPSSNAGGTIMTSVDGLTWTTLNAKKVFPATLQPYFAVYMANVNRWVISTGLDGLFYLSSDNGVTISKLDLTIGRNNPHGIVISEMRTIAYLHGATARPVLVAPNHSGSSSDPLYVRFSYDGIIWRQGIVPNFQTSTSAGMPGMYLAVPHPTPGSGILINDGVQGSFSVDLFGYDRATEFVVPKRVDSGEWPLTDAAKTYIRK